MRIEKKLKNLDFKKKLKKNSKISLKDLEFKRINNLNMEPLFKRVCRKKNKSKFR